MERYFLLRLAAFSALVTLSATSHAQNRMGRTDAGPGDCTPSAQPHECAERCPSFDTCLVASGGGQLYYRVDDQRFDCEGLECGSASQALGDYCCQRGEFAPRKGGNGGCALSSTLQTAPLPPALRWLAAAVAMLSVQLRRRRQGR